MIIGNIIGQKLDIVTPVIASDTIKYLTAKFNFIGDAWEEEGLHKYALFHQDAEHDFQAELDEDGKITTDREYPITLSDGAWDVSIIGVIYDTSTDPATVTTRITTVPVSIYVENSGILSGDPFPEMAGSAGELVLAACAAAQDAAEDAQEAAETAQSKAEEAQGAAEDAAGVAEGFAAEAHKWADGTGASGSDPQVNNHAKYYAGQAAGSAAFAGGKATAAENAAGQAASRAADAFTYRNEAQGFSNAASGSASTARAWADGTGAAGEQIANYAKYWAGKADDHADRAETAQGLAEQAQGYAEEAVEHYPYIDEDSGTWMVWNVAQEEYVDTDVHAQGEKGDKGDKGDAGSYTFDDEPTEDSNNPVKSGGVYTALRSLTAADIEANDGVTEGPLQYLLDTIIAALAGAATSAQLTAFEQALAEDGDAAPTGASLIGAISLDGETGSNVAAVLNAIRTALAGKASSAALADDGLISGVPGASLIGTTELMGESSTVEAELLAHRNELGALWTHTMSKANPSGTGNLTMTGKVTAGVAAVNNNDLMRKVETDAAVQAAYIAALPCKNITGSTTLGADNVPVKSLSVAINAAQAGSGDPTPSNVRNISARTSMTLTVTGESDSETYTVSLTNAQGDVYGGTLNVTTGVLTIDSAITVFTGANAEDWHETSSGVKRFYIHKEIAERVATLDSPLLCNQYKQQVVQASTDLNEYCFIWFASTNNIYIRDSSVADVTAFKARLATQNLQIVYKLITPLTAQLTPTEVKSFLGNNTFSADTGAVTATIRLDPTLAYAALENE